MLAERTRKAARELAEKLQGAFIWSETPQGTEFWLDVQDKLEALAEEPEEAEEPVTIRAIYLTPGEQKALRDIVAALDE